VLHAVSEEYARLQAAFCQVRILERLDDPNRRGELEEARAIAVYHIGTLAHFVADIAQPLHTTEHFDGWVGSNPAGYRWRDRFHAYIDEGFAVRHGIGKAEIKAAANLEAPNRNPANGATTMPAAGDVWIDVREYFARSHALVGPLYTMERDGTLDSDAGRALVLKQLGEATAMLRGLVWQAYMTSTPNDKQVEGWLRYDGEGDGAAGEKSKSRNVEKSK
jgi:hypothetical protein